MAIREAPMTATEFERIAALPENDHRILEFIAGEIFDVPSNPKASKVSMRVGRHFGNFVDERDLGHVTGEAGGYRVGSERYAPDVAYISKARQPELAERGYNPNAPDLAVEVDFPSTLESQKTLRIKVSNYLAAGTVVWVIYPEAQEVEVYTPGQPMRIFGMGDVLDGGEVLPGFRLAVKDIFVP
jgi:Uma2 family endonuclease